MTPARRFGRPALLVILTSGAVSVAALVISPEERTAAQRISSSELARNIQYLASDRLEGRAPGSAGDRLAEEYIAQKFQSLGLKPAAENGRWVQPVPLLGVTGHPPHLEIRNGHKRHLFHYGKDFMAYSGTDQLETVWNNAEWVFVGYGITAPEFGWDDYKGVNVKGKILLFLNSDPEEDPSLFGGKTRLWYGRWDYKFEMAAKRGAAGAIIIHTTGSAGYPWQVVQTSWSGEQFSLPINGAKIPKLSVKGWLTEEAAGRVAQLGGHNLDALRAAAQRRDFRPVPLGTRSSTRFSNHVEIKTTGNVLGFWPGSDPLLARQVVLFTAHHDHLGKKLDAKPGEDAILNGAVDNASGVAELIEVAKAFTALPNLPKRSILFAATAAEEQGLLGSQYLAGHLPVPAGAVAADVNLDGANVWGKTRDVIVVGMGKSSLDGLIEQVALAQGRVARPDPFPDRGFFYRSDQFSFAKLGIPSAYAESGVEFIGRPEGWGRLQRERWEAKQYHQPSDEYDPHWDLSGAVEDAQLYFFLGNRIANDPSLPKWNPGDEFEPARLSALRAIDAHSAATGGR